MHAGACKLVANLPADPRVRPGARLTLKDRDDGGRVWTVDRVHPQVTAKADLKTTGAWWTIK